MTKSLIIGLLLFLTTWRPLYGIVFKYDICNGEKRNHVEWVKTTNVNQTIEFSAINHLDNVSHRMVCDEKLQTISWGFVNAMTGTDYKVARSQNKLIFKGMLNGEIIDKTVAVADLPWYQIHGLSFPEFFKAGGEALLFLSIRPDNGRIVELQASRQGVEEITVNGETVQAVRVDVRLKGMLSRLGKASYWFRASDFVFVRFEGTSPFGGLNSVVYELAELQMTEEK